MNEMTIGRLVSVVAALLPHLTAFAGPCGELPPGFPMPPQIVPTNGPHGVVVSPDPVLQAAGLNERCVFSCPTPVLLPVGLPQSGTNTLAMVLGDDECAFIHDFLYPLQDSNNRNHVEYMRTDETTAVRFLTRIGYSEETASPIYHPVEFEIDNTTGFFRYSTNCLHRTSAEWASVAATETCAYWNRYWRRLNSDQSIFPEQLRPKSVTLVGTIVEVVLVRAENDECVSWLDAKNGKIIGSGIEFR